MKRYADPYVAGVGIGLVLLAAYAIAGRGLGASGAFASVAAAGMAAVEGSERALASPGDCALPDPRIQQPAARLAGARADRRRARRLPVRLARRTDVVGDRAGRTASRGSQRLIAAVAGGVLMGLGAKLARGCTSGQALTGGALLSVGSWIFIATCFAAGYALAPLARRLWR